VRVALNKLANTLKNVTEMENAGRDENSMSTTLSPPVESCSSKSSKTDCNYNLFAKSTLLGLYHSFIRKMRRARAGFA